MGGGEGCAPAYIGCHQEEEDDLAIFLKKENTCNSGGKATNLEQASSAIFFSSAFLLSSLFCSAILFASALLSHQLLSSQLSKLSLSQSCSQTPHRWLMDSCSSLIGGLRWTKFTTSSPLSWDEMIGDEMIADQLIKRGNCKMKGTI